MPEEYEGPEGPDNLDEPPSFFPYDMSGGEREPSGTGELVEVSIEGVFAAENNGNISAYNIGPNGALTPVPGSPFAAWIKPNLSKPMQWLNAAYSIWYNRKYGRVGPLFQGRFKAILHDGRTHGLVINRYLHLNPVRVKRLGGHEGRGEVKKEPAAELSALRVKALGEYRWSS